MKLDKAIKEYEKELAGWSPIAHPVWRDAVKLGLEALKRIKQLEQDHPCCFKGILPGETEE